MRLLTFRTPGDSSGTTLRVGRAEGAGLEDDTVVEIEHAGANDVGSLLALPDWKDVAAAADGPRHRLGDLDLALLVPRPSKVVCVGLNYRGHILEMGRDLPTHPTLFAKFAATLTGPRDDIPLPPEDSAVDWEGELVVVVGERCRRVSEADAQRAIAGYTVANDVSMRTWQFRTKEWLQGKAWEASTPVGPALVTTDEWQPGPSVHTRVNGEEVQSAGTGDLLFGPAALVSYVSTMTTLEPGDLLLTGTPGGVGRAMTPPRYLGPGDVVEVEIDGLGLVRNRLVDEKPEPT
jgi:acylpyruvate hydrolase